jgi:hypothetical protein
MFTLRETGYTDIHTNFRFAIKIYTDAANSSLGVSDTIMGYIISSDLPSANGDAIPWYLPGGMANHQAGPRRVKPINMEFVVSTNQEQSVIRLCEKWGNATYNLNDGTNAGKKDYCTDGISIQLKSEKGSVRYIFRLLRAQIQDINYLPVTSEGQDLLKVSFGLVYDDYKVFNGAGTEVKYLSNG